MGLYSGPRTGTKAGATEVTMKVTGMDSGLAMIMRDSTLVNKSHKLLPVHPNAVYVRQKKYKLVMGLWGRRD